MPVPRVLVAFALFFYALPAWCQHKDRISGRTDFFIFSSVPYMNQFYFRPPGTDKSNGGFWGITIGAGYHYKPRKFCTWQAGANMDFFLPVIGSVRRNPGPTGYLATELMSSFFSSFRDNYVWRRFDMGYGLLISRHYWRKTEWYNTLYGASKDTSMVQSYENWGAGVSLSAYYRFSRVSGVGILYQPQVVSFTGGLRYEHSVSLDFRFLYKRKPKPAITAPLPPRFPDR